MKKACPLANNQEAILRRWEKLSRLSFEAASEKERVLLRDHLPHLLASLCRNLCGHSDDDPTRLSKIHGQQRFTIGNYSLEEVLGEYTILKNVVFETLGEAGDVNIPREMMVIGKFFDEAATTAATEFSKLREAELRRATQRLEVLNSELERFSAIAAHDLRSPIGSMIGYLDVVQEDESLNATSRMAVTRGAAAGRRCLNLIDKLLAYASVDQVHTEQQLVDLNEVTAHAIANLQNEINAEDVRITTGPLAAVKGDADLLTQLMQNLVGNSLKYRSTDHACEISIMGTALAGGFQEISVSDNGVGFENALADEVFQPFTRAHSKAEFAGTGLGLATCQKIVERHGGSIRATTTPGAGTVISFSLPTIEAG